MRRDAAQPVAQRAVVGILGDPRLVISVAADQVEVRRDLPRQIKLDPPAARLADHAREEIDRIVFGDVALGQRVKRD